MNKKWSNELNKITQDTLYNMPVASFAIRDEGCRMKCTNGIFGYITLSDAINGNYNVNLENGEMEKYSSIDTLVNQGWAVD